MTISWKRRLLGGGAISSFLVVAVFLLWSDRAVTMFGQAVHQFIHLGRRVEQGLNVDVVDRSDLPATLDQVGHFFFWAVGMFIAGWVLRRRIPLPITAIFVSGVSLFFEVTGVVFAAIALVPLLAAYRRFFGDEGHVIADPVLFVEEATGEHFLH